MGLDLVVVLYLFLVVLFIVTSDGSSDFLHLEQPSDVGKRNKVFVAKALDAYRIHRLGPLSGLWFLIHWEAESAASAVD